jgi:hypothetical protein
MTTGCTLPADFALCPLRAAHHNLSMDKDQVAKVLVTIAMLPELKGEIPFKTRAYQDAARKIGSLSQSLV